jgi:signal transduction histidine kinase
MLVAHRSSPTEVFTAVAAEVALVLEADFSLIARFEADATLTHLAAHPPGFLSRLGPRRTLRGDDPASIVRRSGRTAWINYDNLPGSRAALARELGFRWSVATPILVDDRIWGVVAAGWAQPRTASTETAERIAEFTELVGTAVANAESRAELVASRARVVAAGDETRRRIERDLHDGAQQRLVTLALKLRSMTSTIPAGSTDLHVALDEVAAGLEGVLDDLRELSRGIHPTVLSRAGLAPALNALARRAPIPVEVDVRAPTRPPEHIEAAVYYVVAETLTNAAKHGQASGAIVDVEAHDGSIRVSVCDDGIGGADPSRGSGLLGLRDRVDAFGGTMVLSSPPGDGTSIVVDITWTSE